MIFICSKGFLVLFFAFHPHQKLLLHIIRVGTSGCKAVGFYPWLCHCLSRWSLLSHRPFCSLGSVTWDQCLPNFWQTLATLIIWTFQLWNLIIIKMRDVITEEEYLPYPACWKPLKARFLQQCTLHFWSAFFTQLNMLVVFLSCHTITHT